MTTSTVPDRLANVIEEDRRLLIDERDRRDHDRIPFRTLLTMLVANHSDQQAVPRSMTVWSIDVSQHGAGIVASEKLPTKNLFIRFLLPWAGDRTLECEVVRTSQLDGFLGEKGVFYCHGVRFKRLLTDVELEAVLKQSQTGQ